MSADMIGYLVIGPTQLNPVRVEETRVRLEKLKELLVVWEEDEGGDAEEMDDRFYDAAGKVMDDEFWAERFVNQCMEPASLKAFADFDEFVEWWNGGHNDARDTMTRGLPDGRVIVSCGDMSYGDEPEGRGYTLVRDMALLGVFKHLGIE
mgnify:FL=1